MIRIILFAAVSFVASATLAEAATLGLLTYEIDGDSITITDCDPSAYGELTIPELIESKPVATIGWRAFAFNRGLTLVNIPTTVTTIEDFAFDNCNALINVSIPSSVTSIGERTFRGCSLVTSVFVPASVTSLGPGVFTDCDSLLGIDVAPLNPFYSSLDGILYDKTQLSLLGYPTGRADGFEVPATVKHIGDWAFYSCKSLSNIVIPESVESIGRSAFQDCDQLESIEIPASITSVGISAFSSCGALTTVVVPSSVMILGDSSFSSCGSLTSVSIAPGVTTIGERAFASCVMLATISLPSTVTSIGRATFDLCHSLSEIQLPASVRNIGSGAFARCRSLDTIEVHSDNPSFTSAEGVLYDSEMKSLIGYPAGRVGGFAIPEGVESIGELAFGFCDYLDNLSFPSTVVEIGEKAFQRCRALPDLPLHSGLKRIGESAFDQCHGLIDVIIPSGVEMIGPRAFSNCADLTTISVPATVTEISEGNFGRSHSLTEINVDSSNQFYSSIEGVLLDKDSTVVFSCPRGKAGGFDVPSTVTEIGPEAFYGCHALTEISLPSGLRTIGRNAFSWLGSLQNLVLPMGLVDIGNRAFEDCDKLSSITIPATVASIGSTPFRYCENLAEIDVEIGNVVYSSDDGVLYNRAKRRLIAYPGAKEGSFEAPNTITEIESYAFADCIGLSEVILPEGDIKIGVNAFSSCINLTAIVIPPGVQRIADGVFSNCTRLERISIPTSVTSIGERAFLNCSSLRDISIPNGVKVIPYQTFSGCSELTSVSTPSSVEAIGDFAFRSCNKLSEMVLPERLTVIGSFAFESCEALTGISIPLRVALLNSNAFSDCSNLMRVTIAGDSPRLGHDVFDGVATDAIALVRPTSTGFSETFGGLPVVVETGVVGRYLSYQGSVFSDNDAIAEDKLALLPGQKASFDHYSSYNKGINGIVVDVSLLAEPGQIDAGDFRFHVGNSNDTTSWIVAPDPSSVEVELGGGEGGSDRIKIIWPYNAIEKQWLRVAILSNAHSGLLEDDVFYFGNAIGDTGQDLARAIVTISDENAARHNPRNFLDPALIDNPHDFNRDGLVNISDENTARQHGTNFLTELIMLDLTSVIRSGPSRASVVELDRHMSVGERLSIQRSSRRDEFLIEARFPLGKKFQLQQRSSVVGREWRLIGGTVQGRGEEVNRWLVPAQEEHGIYRILPSR